MPDTQKEHTERKKVNSTMLTPSTATILNSTLSMMIENAKMLIVITARNVLSFY